MFRKFIWPLLLLASISLMVVFIIGFSTSITVSNGNRIDATNTSEPVVTQPTQEIDPNDTLKNEPPNILILGDSIGFGIGDDTNQGLGKRYALLLDPEGLKAIKIANLSVPGARVGDLLESLKQPENSVALSEATLIILSIGGNDINNIDSSDTLTTEIDYRETLKQYTESLQGIVSGIRMINNRAQLTIIGLYDPYAENDTYKTNLLLQWNYETQRIAATDLRMVYVPTYDLFKYHLKAYLAVDQFHPSGVGYQAISEELYRILHGVTSK